MIALVRYNAMCRAIAAAYAVDEVKSIRDKAIALEHYARQAHNVEAERQACEIRLRAERKAGALSKKLDKSKGGRPGKTLPANGRVSTKWEQLKAAGISVRQAEDWENAAVPEDEFERRLASMERPTTSGLIRAKEKPPNALGVPVANDALWLWGRLLDFEGDGLLTKEPPDVLLTMTESMKDDVHRLAPKVSAWLKRIGELP